MSFAALEICLKDLLEKGVPALEVLVQKDHEVLFHACKGYSDVQKTKPTLPADRYWLYSCTKPILIASAMKAMEEGLFTIEDPVMKFLPAYRDVYLLENGLRKKPDTPITIFHLMTMTAGLDYDLQSEPIRRTLAQTKGKATTEQISEALAEKPLLFMPGSRYQYSLCLDVLGAVIARASGETLSAYMQRTLFDPLEMHNTAFVCGKAPKNLSAQYSYQPETNTFACVGWQNQYVLSENFHSGGAGLVSTAEDAGKFTDALACGGLSASGVQILKEESIQSMRSLQLTPFDPSLGFSCTCGPEYGYGLGVRTRITQMQGAQTCLGEFGWDGAAGADFLIDPVHHISLVYMEHVLNWLPLHGAVHLALRDALYSDLFGRA